MATDSLSYLTAWEAPELERLRLLAEIDEKEKNSLYTGAYALAVEEHVMATIVESGAADANDGIELSFQHSQSERDKEAGRQMLVAAAELRKDLAKHIAETAAEQAALINTLFT